MNWKYNISLKQYNTFGIAAKSEKFVAINSILKLKELCLSIEEDIFILGGGSNILLPDTMSIPVIKNELKGIDIVNENEGFVTIKIMSGEGWHEFVKWAVEQNYGGIENLALIPGTIGAAPIQNIGAYGVELKDVLLQVEAMEIKTGMLVLLSNEDCEFGYRDSIFKGRLKGKYFITALQLKLSKKDHPLKLDYGSILEELAILDINDPAIKDVFDVVVAIRTSKLPDPKKIGNSGSFFKNIELSIDELNQLKDKIGEVLNFPMNNGMFKVPTGWLLEKCGWKGKTIGNVGCYEKQALIIINTGRANGEEIRQFANGVIEDVFLKTGIKISPEVNFIPKN